MSISQRHEDGVDYAEALLGGKWQRCEFRKSVRAALGASVKEAYPINRGENKQQRREEGEAFEMFNERVVVRPDSYSIDLKTRTLRIVEVGRGFFILKNPRLLVLKDKAIRYSSLFSVIDCLNVEWRLHVYEINLNNYGCKEVNVMIAWLLSGCANEKGEVALSRDMHADDLYVDVSAR